LTAPAGEKGKSSMRPIAILLALLGIVAAGFWLLTMPERLPETAISAPGRGVAARGERIFWAGGCASCHASAGAKGAERFKLGGGAPLKTPFGSFHAPNISPDRVAGIGAWSIADFANAMQRGVDPDGRHLYPAFPYASYQRMTKGDIADLFAFLQTLPPVARAAPENDLAFPFNIRRGIGLWKRAIMADAGPVIALKGQPAAVNLGQYLVEGPGHCSECHTPRGLNGLGRLDTAHWLAGAPSVDGPGKVPNITPGKAGIGSWSAGEIADYLESGFTPDYDSVGGSMVEVQANMAKLTPEDRAAIAAYLKAIPPR
jgi:mono/diheme cytochrome c family protein